MTFVFISCYLTHHQLPFCLEMQRHLGEDFCFVATEETEEERLLLGFQNLNEAYPFVLRAYEGETQEKQAQKLADTADVVMIGSAPWSYIQKRLAEGKLTFLYSERLYKESVQYWKFPVRMWRFWKKYGRHKSLYLLCASAFTAGDFAKTLTFRNKAYKWGYFPETKRYNVQELLQQKKPNRITWAGRFIEWKHPEYVIEVAARLKAEGYQFQIDMLGNGELWDSIKKMVEAKGLQEQVRLPGAMSPEEVRRYMEQSAIYLFTSDRHEGWGAVTNEAMNSGCAVVAGHNIGAVPFLIRNGENGVIFRSNDIQELYEKVKFLLDHPEKCKNMGIAAYKTITEVWNAETATNRLLALVQTIGNQGQTAFEAGPCSKAPLLKDNWYKGQEKHE